MRDRRPVLVACPKCEGDTIRLSEVGGIVHNGPCPVCDGTGLVPEETVED